MKLSTHIKPISYLNAHAAEVVRTLDDQGEPLVITQNGESDLLYLSKEFVREAIRFGSSDNISVCLIRKEK